jgi:hypothetical protein
MSDAEHCRAQAAKCRLLAKATADKRTLANLLLLAEDYEQEALKLERGPDPELPLPPLE